VAKCYAVQARRGDQGKIRLTTIDKIEVTHPALFFYKFFLDPRTELKAEFLRSFHRGLNGKELENLQKACEERLKARTETLRSLSPPYQIGTLRAKVVWRLIIGLGSAHGLETSLTLHRLYGFPYLPGSAVKGLLRTYALLELWNGGARSALEGFKYEMSEDLTAVNKALMTGDLPKLHQAVQGKAEIYDGLVLIHRIFGSQREQGQVIFFDVLPVNRVKLELDIMNPHYSKYYTGGEPPADWQSPNPIPFLTVGQGTEFQFLWASRNATLVQEVGEWLKKAVKDAGVGAKTMAGYGELVPV